MKKGFEGASYTPEATPEEVAEYVAKQKEERIGSLAEKIKQLDVTVAKSTEAPEPLPPERSPEERKKFEKVNEAFLSHLPTETGEKTKKPRVRSQKSKKTIEEVPESVNVEAGVEKEQKETAVEGKTDSQESETNIISSSKEDNLAAFIKTKREDIKTADLPDSEKALFEGVINTIEKTKAKIASGTLSGQEKRKAWDDIGEMVTRLRTGKELGVTPEKIDAARREAGAQEAHIDEKETQQVAPVVGEKDILPKSAREYLDSRRIGIENDEMLSRTQKDEFLKLTDELEAIETDFSTKKLSTAEAFKKRGRKKHLKSILTTGAEAGVTKEQVENAREAGEALGEAPANLPIEEEPVVVAKPEKVMQQRKPRAKRGSLEKVQSIPSFGVNPEVAQASVEALTPETVEARATANEILKSVPDKEKPALWKKIMGAGFLLQEGKNKLLEKTFGTTYNLLYKKEGESSKQKGGFQLALRSLARGYEKSAKQSKEDRLDFYERGKKTNLKAWGNLASGGILGLRIIAGPMGALSRLPAVVATSLSRFAETAKEVRFDKKMQEVSEEEAAEEAWAIYESAQKEAMARGEEGATFDDLSRAYGAGVLRGGPDAQLEAGTGTLTQIGMRKGFEEMFSPLKQKYDAIQADGTLSVKEKQTQTSALFKKNEGLIKDIDRLVGPLGTIDTAGYYLKRAGVWSKRFAHLVALESLAEFGFNKALESAAESDVVVNYPVDFSEGIPSAEAGAGEVIAKQGFENINPWDAEAAVHPENTTETIKEGGSMWRAAKAIQEKLGMDNVAFAEGWGNSTATLPDGREIPLSELDLVHAGDSLSYEDGKFVFENGSGIEHAEHVSGGLEMNQIETIDAPASSLDDVSVEDIGQGVGADVEMPHEDFSEQGLSEERGGFESMAPENLSLEQLMSPENIEREMNRDLHAIFGTLQEDRSEWTQWKTMSARKFLEKMRFPNDTPAKRLQHYLSVLSRGSDFRPIGGFFRRDESIETFIKRALTVVIQRETTQ